MMVRIPRYAVVGEVLATGRGYVDVQEDDGTLWTVPEDMVEEDDGRDKRNTRR